MSYEVDHFGDRSHVVEISYSGGVTYPNKKGFLPRNVIPWDENISLQIVSFFQKLDYPYRKYAEIPFEDPLRSEIRRFLISLDAYIESPFSVIPEKSILFGATKRDYATYLKRVRRKAFESTWGVDHFAIPDWWDEVPAYNITDIGQIFNYSYLIFWDQIDEEDYKWGFTPVDIKERRLKKFYSAVRSLLPARNKINLIDPHDVLMEISGSVCIDKYGKKSHHYLTKKNKLFFSKRRGPVRRCVINVSPNNIRDTILNQVEDLNTITLIDRQTMDILRLIPEHIHLTDKELITSRYKHLINKFFIFIQRDIKKEGITKPRELLKTMLEALHDSYPDIEIYQYTDFYDEYNLIMDDDQIISPPRGHGLGMANALTTLMQLAIHRMIVDELTDDIPSLECEALILNDDFVVGFNDEYHQEAYWDKEDEVMKDLSLLRAPDKSFVSRGHFVLAERYFNRAGEHEKISYQMRELYYPLTCYNVTHAKEYFISAQAYTNIEVPQNLIGEIMTFWGYEFHPNEFIYPSIVGGWINETIKGVSLALTSLENLPYEWFVPAGFKANLVKPRKRGGGKRTLAPALYLMPGITSVPERYYEAFDLLGNSRLHEKYGRLLSRSAKYFEKYYTDLYKARRKIFKENFHLPFTELAEEILREYSSTCFYPCEFMIDHHEEHDKFRVKINDVYLDPNARMALYSKYCDSSYPFKEEFSIQFTRTDSISSPGFRILTKEIQRAIRSEIMSILFTGDLGLFIYPRDESIHPERLYLNPFSIGLAANQLEWSLGYPIIKERYISEIIKLKEEVYGRLFSFKELEYLTKREFSRSSIKLIVGYAEKHGLQLIEAIEEMDRLYERLQDLYPDYDESKMDKELDKDESSMSKDDRFWQDLFTTEPYGDGREEIYCSMEKLMTEEFIDFILCHLTPNYEWRFENETVEEAFSMIRFWYRTLNDERLCNRDQVTFMIEQLKFYRPESIYLVKSSGLYGKAERFLQGIEDTSIEDLPSSLFGEE